MTRVILALATIGLTIGNAPISAAAPQVRPAPQLTLTSDKLSYTPGERPSFTLTVRNVAAVPITISATAVPSVSKVIIKRHLADGRTKSVHAVRTGANFESEARFRTTDTLVTIPPSSEKTFRFAGALVDKGQGALLLGEVDAGSDTGALLDSTPRGVIVTRDIVGTKAGKSQREWFVLRAPGTYSLQVIYKYARQSTDTAHTNVVYKRLVSSPVTFTLE